MIRRLLVLLFLLIAAMPARAQDATVPVPAAPGMPPEPEARGDEWVRLESGEWLKGQVQYMRDDRLSFESDKLHDLDIDWEDVPFAWLPREHIWVFEEGGVLHGSGVVLEDTVMVQTPEGTVAFPRDRLSAIVRGGRRLDMWHAYLSLGLDGRWGNAAQFTLSGAGGVSRDDGRTQWKIDYNWSWGLTRDVKTVDNHRAATQFNIYVTKEFYITAAYVEGYLDDFQNIAPRVTAAAGVGVRLKPTRDLTLTGQTGLAYQYVRYITVAAGEEPMFQGIGAIVAVGSQWEITGDIDLDLFWVSTLIFNDFGKTSHHGTLEFDHEIIDDVEYNLKLVFDRTEDPTQGQAGEEEVVPNDLQLIVGFTLEL